jgi:hypothetical protein
VRLTSSPIKTNHPDSFDLMNILIVIAAWVSAWIACILLERFCVAPLRRKVSVAGWIGIRLVLACVFVLVCFHALDVHLAANLSAHDKDGDGVFSPWEQTAAQQQDFDLLVNDSGRNFLKLVAPVLYLLLSAIALSLSRRKNDEKNSDEKIGSR